MSAMKGSHHFLSSKQDINVIPFFILLGLVLATYGTYLWLLPRPFPGIPYNPEAARSILGDIPRLSAETSNTKDLMGWLRKQVERHQSPLVQVFIRPFAKPILVLSDYQETHDIVLHRNKDFDRSSFTTEAFGGLTPNFHIIYKTGPEWKSHRKLLQDLMTPTFLDGIAAPAIHDNMLDIVALWKLKTSLAADQPFLASQDIHNAALDAVLSFSFGKNFPFRATKPQIDLIAGISEVPTVKGEKAVAFPEATLHYGIQAMIDLAESMVQVKSSAVPRLKWWALSWMPHMARAWRDKNNCIKQEIMKSVQASKVSNTERKDERVHSAVDHIVDRETRFAQKEGRTPDYFSPIMQDEVFGFVMAGHDTTSTTLAWGIKLLADHPSAQTRLRTALLHAFPADRIPTCTEVTKTPLPYLDAVVEEILRHAGTVPAVDREALRDTQLLGHFVPKGTVVFAVSNGPGVLAPGFAVDEGRRSETARKAARKEWRARDVGAFRPERWLVRGDGRTGAEREDAGVWWMCAQFDAQAGPSMPFGGGLRGCFGRRLAYLEMRMFLALVVWHFELLPCPREVSGYEAYDGVVHKPKHCYVRLREVQH